MCKKVLVKLTVAFYECLFCFMRPIHQEVQPLAGAYIKMQVLVGTGALVMTVFSGATVPYCCFKHIVVGG